MTLKTILTVLLLVESGGKPNPPDGDQGRSIGPYQIMYSYWKDSATPGEYQQCRNRRYAQQVVCNYWKRHCPEAYGRARQGKATVADFQKMARIHNGGPMGYKNPRTIKYWGKCQKALANQGK